MPQDLFDSITAPAPRSGRRSPYTIAGSIAAHVGIIAAIVIVPLLATDALPIPFEQVAIPVFGEVVPPPPPPLASAGKGDRGGRWDETTTSREAPDGISEETEAPASGSGAPTIGDSPGAPDGVEGGLGTPMGRPEPPPPTPVPPNRPVPVGGKIREPQKIHSVAPVYPGIARTSRVEGTVVIEAVIGVDGAVREARVRTSVPLLDQAALDAVRQWRYRPTMLNGVAVPVIMTVSVRFTLQ